MVRWFLGFLILETSWSAISTIFRSKCNYTIQVIAFQVGSWTWIYHLLLLRVLFTRIIPFLVVLRILTGLSLPWLIYSFCFSCIFYGFCKSNKYMQCNCDCVNSGFLVISEQWEWFFVWPHQWWSFLVLECPWLQNLRSKRRYLWIESSSSLDILCTIAPSKGNTSVHNLRIQPQFDKNQAQVFYEA